MAIKLYPNSDFKDYERCLRATCCTVDYLATNAKKYDLQFRYGYSIGYINSFIKKTIQLILQFILPDAAKWPNADARHQLSEEIKGHYQLPLCIGAVDGTYVFCKGMGNTPLDYTCRKSDFCFNLVLFMNYKLQIIHYISNNVGAIGDQTIFRSSPLIRNSFDNFALNNDDRTNALGLRSYYIVADKGIQNGSSIITPYDERFRVLSAQQKGFNYWICKFKVLSEICIGMLKLRFLVLKERLRTKDHLACDEIIHTCIALHNYSID